MVERVPDEIELDKIFRALAHPIRRAIIDQVAGGPVPVSGVADPHDVSLTAVSKHIHKLEDAGLVEIETDGQVRRCHLDAAPLSVAFSWLLRYRLFWEDRFDALGVHLENDQS